MRTSKYITNSLTVCVLGASVTCFAGQSKAPAQTDSKQTPATASGPSGKSRTRRVVNPKTEKKKVDSHPEDVDPAPETEPDSDKPTAPVDAAPVKEEARQDETAAEKPEPPRTQPTATATPTDPVTTAREQIEAATTPGEKARLQFQLVELLVARDEKQAALNELHAMAAVDRFDPIGFYNVGNALARLGDSNGAVSAYRKAIEQRKGRYSRALNNLGVVLLRQGLWDEAYDSLNAALRLENFRYAEASYNLGRLYAARGEHDLAIREWKRAIVVNPEHTAAAQALASAGTGFTPTGPSPVPRPKVSNSTAERSPQPSQIPVESLSTRPTKASSAKADDRPVSVDAETYAFLQRARQAKERNRQEEAVENYRRVIARMGGYFGPANLELSYSLINLKRLDEAIASLLTIVKHEGDRYPISYYYLARLYEGRGDLRMAEENFSKAASLYRDDNAQFLLDVSRVREKLGDYQGALSVLEDYLSLMEKRNLKPDWSDERLNALRDRVAKSASRP
jgi:tetratricopeptide (TPR) repeat protein